MCSTCWRQVETLEFLDVDRQHTYLKGLLTFTLPGDEDTTVEFPLKEHPHPLSAQAAGTHVTEEGTCA